jgi:hypothetical protein
MSFMFSRATCLIVLAAVSLPRQTSSPAPPVAQNFVISGTVAHAMTGEVLGQVEVSIAPVENPGAQQSMVTGDNGRFRFEALAPGRYRLAGERRGFPRQSFEEHEEFSTAIAIGPDLKSEGLVFPLRPDSSISGVVTDDLNEPLREARVMLFREMNIDGAVATGLLAESVTNDLGRYRFGHLLPGRYFVAVSAVPWYAQVAIQPASDPAQAIDRPDTSSEPEEARSALEVAYPLTYFAGTKEESAATPLELNPGDQATADVPLSPVPAARLRIHVTETDTSRGFGAFLARRSFGSQPVPMLAPMTPGANKGDFDIVGVAPGSYEVNVTSEGDPSQSWKREVELSKNLEVTGAASVTLSPLSGVVSLDGQPAPTQGQVHLRNENSMESFSAPIAANGEFRFQSGEVQAGTYQVSVSDVPAAGVTQMTASGARATGQILVMGDETPVHLAISMSRGVGSVTGVALLNDKPLGGLMVVLVPEDPETHASRFRRDQSATDGTFALLTVMPGKYTVLAIKDGWDLEWGRAGALKPYLAGGEVVEVAAKGKYPVKVNAQ